MTDQETVVPGFLAGGNSVGSFHLTPKLIEELILRTTKKALASLGTIRLIEDKGENPARPEWLIS
jgi:hypothetical protein